MPDIQNVVVVILELSIYCIIHRQLPGHLNLINCNYESFRADLLAVSL